jgi:RNA polymerase sigma factor (sigma-70 family)
MPERALAATPVRPRAAETTRDLYARHGQRVYSFCQSRLRHPEEAQDAAQTTFMYVLSSVNRGIVPRNELAWLLTIADNVCRSTRRSLGRRQARIADAEIDELEAAAQFFNAETAEQLEALRAGLAQLPDSQRRAILLREWQGLSYADIAEQLGLTVPAVETLLFRARRSLATLLDRSRARLAALDVGAVFTFVRSLLGSGAGKLAVGAAGVAVVATVPAVERKARASHPGAAPARVAASTHAQMAPAVEGARPAAHRARPHARTKQGGRRTRLTATTVGARHAPSSTAPQRDQAQPPSTPAPDSGPGSVPVTTPVSVPPPPPAQVPPPVEAVVTTVTETVAPVVATVVPPPPLPPLGP